jgi:glycyl-tRNA synthetase beta subunit
VLVSLFLQIEAKSDHLFAVFSIILSLEMSVLFQLRVNHLQIVFSRPIRWIFALHGDLIVPFCFAGISSGNQSCGLRNSSLANFKVEAAELYLHTLEKAGILIDMQVRWAHIIFSCAMSCFDFS